MSPRRALAVGLGLATLAMSATLARPCEAQLGANGAPIATSNYTVDLYQGPVLASTRLIGLAGAYVAIAEGVEGNFVNPAASAVRLPWSYTHVDYDIGAGMSFPSALKSSDFFNSGAKRTNLTTSDPNQFLFMDAEGHLQLGPWGVGAAVALQQYGLRRNTVDQTSARKDELRGQFAIGYLHLARTTADGQLILGVGARTTGLSVTNQNAGPGQSEALFSTQGVGYEAGVLWRPKEQPFRFGATIRSEVSSTAASNTSGETSVDGSRLLYQSTPDQMYLPHSVSLPWDVNVGFAVQLGARPFNPRWFDPDELLEPLRRALRWRALERQRRRSRALEEAKSRGRSVMDLANALDAEIAAEASLDAAELAEASALVDRRLREHEKAQARWYVLLSTSLMVTGPVNNAVGVESFLQRVVDRSGERTVVSPHFGVEAEVIPNWLRLRAGGYGEPTRFANSRAAPRIHATVGAEQKLFPWQVFGLYSRGTEWRIQGAMDVSERYFGWSASVGIWH